MVLGLGFYIPFSVALYRQSGWYPFNNVLQRVPSSYICLVVCCLLLVFLSLELVLRIGSLIICIIRRRQNSSEDSTSQEKIKPYQILFGHSSSRIYEKYVSPSELKLEIQFEISYSEHTRTLTMLSTEYYTSDSHMKFVLFWRRFLLRVILISCLFSLAFVPSIWIWLGSADYLWIALLPIIMFHHLLRYFFFSCW